MKRRPRYPENEWNMEEGERKQKLRTEGSEKLPTPGLLSGIVVPWDELGCTHSAKAYK